MALNISWPAIPAPATFGRRGEIETEGRIDGVDMGYLCWGTRIMRSSTRLIEPRDVTDTSPAGSSSAMAQSDSDARIQTRPDSGRRGNRKLVYLVSYPRSGNTLVREYFSLLQGRAQQSIYPGDVVDPTDAALTHALDHIEIIKSHRIPADGSPMICLVRDACRSFI